MLKKRLRRLLIADFTWKRLARSLLLVYVSLCLYVFFRADAHIFLPQPSSYSYHPDLLKLITPDQIQLAAVYLPNPHATYTLLYIHGNAEDLGDIQPVLQNLRKIGFSVFAYDYRGYGMSEGTPTERNAYRDVETAYNYLTQELKIPPNQIILYGRSVGGGSAVDLAANQPVAGLILESTFTKAFRVLVPFPIFPFEKFANLDKIKQVNCPVLVIHGKADRKSWVSSPVL
ncbi:alpha/beta hydrolase [Oscillatoria salina]|uniref:alpha/beta hydrolase n=1 Tax=Oscillatoria salina TaxID=331517 RepID=UPI001CCD7358|nr:alpha/beta fold hydrolase [Oscillatoria salina]MBZ8178928.1 alpha/beta hydrolase [Oscillatoria salina IIICB1]